MNHGYTTALNCLTSAGLGCVWGAAGEDGVLPLHALARLRGRQPCMYIDPGVSCVVKFGTFCRVPHEILAP